MSDNTLINATNIKEVHRQETTLEQILGANILANEIPLFRKVEALYPR